MGGYLHNSCPVYEGAKHEDETYLHRRDQHDNLPQWDGNKPHDNLINYMRQLGFWLHTTPTAKNLQGFTIWPFADGTLKKLIGDITDEDLTSGESGTTVKKFIVEKNSQQCTQRKKNEEGKGKIKGRGRGGNSANSGLAASSSSIGDTLVFRGILKCPYPGCGEWVSGRLGLLVY